MKIDKALPFALAYLDWAKEVKGVTSFEDTERRDWVMEFGKVYSDAGGEFTGVDIILAMGAR